VREIRTLSRDPVTVVLPSSRSSRALLCTTAMAAEVQQLIQRVIRGHLFPQLIEEEARLAAGLSAATACGVEVNPSSSSSSFSSSARARHPDARERRRLAARCRTLKADISRFEADFRAAHAGRDPRPGERGEGAVGRVYEEYKQLKAVIRTGAAVQIQALVRGHIARGVGRAASGRRRGGLVAGSARGRGGSAAASSSSSSSAPGAPGGPILTGAPAGPSGAARPTLSLAGSASSSTAASSAALARLAALRDEKAALKRRLRQFDADFAAAHSRPPHKAEKEHLRPAYTRYHELKGLIQDLEDSTGSARGRDADSPPPPSSAAAGGSSRAAASSSAAAPAPQASSSAGAAASLSSSTGAAAKARPSSAGSAGSGGGSAPPPEARLRSDSGASGIGLDADDADDVGPGSGAAGGGGGSGGGVFGNSGGGGPKDAATAERVGQLRGEKKRLQSALRDYEKDFAARHGRPVKFVKDIAPVMEKYTRYKQLKAQLKELGAA
jgi:hypothetical protein